MCFCIESLGFKHPLYGPIDQFVDIVKHSATSDGQYTDKVAEHSYEIMYGAFLMPLVNALKGTNETIKVLEIGLGCDMVYGPGKSLAVWRNLYGKNAEIWEGEYDEACIKNNTAKFDNVHVLTGDQGNKTTLDRWVKESGGKFNTIIDDGGHKNYQIKATFDTLFEQALLPGKIIYCFLKYIVCCGM